MIKLLYLLLLLLSIALEPAACQEFWNLGSSQDWLSAGPIYSTSSYYTSPYYTGPYYYYPYSGIPSGFTDFYFADYAYRPYYYGPYWDYTYSWPYLYGYSAELPASPWLVGAHRDLPKTIDYARAHSSLRVYRDGVWLPP
ncbi:MAG: hypothetical protein QUS09_03340 [Methanotrichaceae archaeon]|nr:hypothetical protein [Methanotrichaceae archaeon]